MSDFDRYDDNFDKEQAKQNFLDMLGMMSRINDEAHKKQNEDTMKLAKVFYSQYEAFNNAGFNEEQSFELLLHILSIAGNGVL